ncbi:hypothetical protein BDQ17DRAFT_1335651 [Cyathus striatus]|nr:hypothetical protein BDQ17DRAFT_1335651 [Cyathus striatus]
MANRTGSSKKAQISSTPAHKPQKAPLQNSEAENDVDKRKGLKPTNSVKSTRRPLTILSDSESDVAQPQQDKHHNGRRHSINNREEDAESLSSLVLGDDDEINEDEGDNDLHQLDGNHLREVLTVERVQWSHNDEFQDEEPSPSTIYYHHISLGDEQYGVVDGEDEQNEPKSDEDGTSHNASHHTAQRRAERPYWQVVKESKTKLSKVNSRKDININFGWGQEAHFVQPRPRARMISLLDQPQPFQDALKAAINIQTGDALFKTFFPDVGPTYRNFRKLLKGIAKQLNYPVLAERLGKDVSIGQEGGRVLNHHIGNMRGKSKAAVSSTVGAYYGIEALGTVAEQKELVMKILDDGDYVYPRTALGKLIDTKPYYHPCLISGIQKFFFLGSCGTYAQRYRKRFKSSHSDYPSELELPLALVSIIATSIHASLEDWSTGVHRSTDFNYDLLEDIYNGHEEFFSGLHQDYPGKYHVLMHGLYKNCSSDAQSAAPAVSISQKNKLLNMEGMEDVAPTE